MDIMDRSMVVSMVVTTMGLLLRLLRDLFLLRDRQLLRHLLRHLCRLLRDLFPLRDLQLPRLFKDLFLPRLLKDLFLPRLLRDLFLHRRPLRHRLLRDQLLLRQGNPKRYHGGLLQDGIIIIVIDPLAMEEQHFQFRQRQLMLLTLWLLLPMVVLDLDLLPLLGLLVRNLSTPTILVRNLSTLIFLVRNLSTPILLIRKLTTATTPGPKPNTSGPNSAKQCRNSKAIPHRKSKGHVVESVIANGIRRNMLLIG